MEKYDTSDVIKVIMICIGMAGTLIPYFMNNELFPSSERRPQVKQSR